MTALLSAVLAAPAAGARRLHSWLVGSQSGLVGLALIIGGGAGLGAVVFRFLIIGITDLVTGRDDFSTAGRVASLHLPALGPWFLLLAPVAGGLVYGPLVHRFAPEARGHGVPEVMVAVARNGGRIPARVAAVKSLASALCIGTGGSVGREGPIVQIGSALGSSIGQWLRVPDHRLRLMVACGAAGGISATFNAPIAGVFFALEIILRAFTAEAFGIVVISSVTANAVSRAIVGNDHILTLPAYSLGSTAEFPFYAVLGLAAGVVGWGFARVLYLVEDACDHVWRGPEWLRPAVGGLLLGGVLLALPQMYGVGYPVLEAGISGHYALGLLLLLLVGKMVATSLTIGIGGSGGVFAPSLFVGGMLGTAFGIAAQAVFPGLDLSPGAFGLVGMAAVFAAASHAPIAAALIVFELTGQYAIILPLLAAVALATGLSHLISRDTIYTLKLLRRGVDIDADSRADGALRTLTVGQAMQPPPDDVPADTAVDDLMPLLGGARYGALPVTAPDGRFRGAVVTADLDPGDRDGTTAGHRATLLPALHSGDSLHHALRALSHHETTGLPVLADDRLVGWLDHRDVLTAYGRGSTEDRADQRVR
ncbi:chloride channel protein [Pseudonocardia halophobica]|uniref:Transport integral membrane protein n=1 Tax=Pseudonocardia halophobica TaxID=29401 RepID=A0A9W6NUJ9_9PSEU|nr:chloride channel protein [Pseudonocardia halophobica]GLL09402.1 transport integral membrane protein [Pseudonocardia halophobica]